MGLACTSSSPAAATVAELTSPRHNTVSGFNVSSNYSLFDPFCSTLTQSYNIMDIYDLFFINKDGEEEELGFFFVTAAFRSFDFASEGFNLAARPIKGRPI